MKDRAEVFKKKNPPPDSHKSHIEKKPKPSPQHLLLTCISVRNIIDTNRPPWTRLKMYRAAWINFKESKKSQTIKRDLIFARVATLCLATLAGLATSSPTWLRGKRKSLCGWDTWDDGGPPKKPWPGPIYPQLKSYVFHAFFPRDKQQGFWFPRSRNGVSGPENKFFLVSTCSLIGSRFLVHSVIDYSRSLKRKRFF